MEQILAVANDAEIRAKILEDLALGQDHDPSHGPETRDARVSGLLEVADDLRKISDHLIDNTRERWLRKVP